MEDTENVFEEIKSFDDLDIDTSILRGIYACGFESPSPIQKKGILPILAGRDVIGQAQSGTGKTATFCIGGLSRVDGSVNEVQLLILSPTRELTLQISTVIKDLLSMQKEQPFRVKTLVGGNSVYEDVNDIRSQYPHIIVGCPGRVTDVMINRNAFDGNTIKTFILDEADEMLKSGFQEQVCNIFKFLNPEVQTVLFSATMPPNMFEVTKKFMRDPVVISVEAANLSLEGIKQCFMVMETDNDKYEKLLELFKKVDIKQCIIYANSVDRVKHLTKSLSRDGFSVCEIHSELDKMEREHVLNEFKSGKFRTLISTDLTARGIDVQQVSLVINFDIPRCENNYLHRIGRSGRWGRQGKAINFVTKKDITMMQKIEKHYEISIEEFTL
jgi:translation initiation factor 4A